MLDADSAMNEDLKKIIALMQRDDSGDAPAESIKWAKNVFRANAPAAQPSFVRRVIATLQSSLGAGEPAFGERSAAAARSRQMLYSADGDVGVHITITKSKNTKNIRGQVLSDTFSPTSVKLSDGFGRDFDSEVVDGEFEFSGIRNGNVSLALRADSLEVVIETIEL